MAWIFLAESAVFHSAFLHGCPQPLIVRQNDTAKECYCRVWHRDNSQPPQYGMTLDPLRDPNWMEKPLILSTADSPARISVLQDLEQAWMASVQDSFSRSFDYVAKYDPDSFSWKTSQLSLFGGLTEFLWSSLRWGMMRDGRLYQPQKWEPRIFENDGSYLPTPTACDYGKNVGRKSAGITPSGLDRWSLTVRSRRGELPGHPKGKLNPEWIEQAMGYPTGWTAIADWAMQWCHPKRERHLKG